jgi:hypothetical protein
VDALGVQFLDADSRVGLGGQLLGDQRDRRSGDPAIGIGEIARDLDAGVFLLGERRLRPAQGE